MTLRALAVAAYASVAAWASVGARAGAQPAPAGVAAVRLEADADSAPLGIDDATPRLSWALTSGRRGVMQTGYHVVVATRAELARAGRGDVWDSRAVTSAEPAVVYAGPALRPRTRYFWSVQVATNAGSTAWAPPAWFETALLAAPEWQGYWIAGPERPGVLTPAEGIADDSVVRATGELCRPPMVPPARAGGPPGAARRPDPNTQGQCREVRPAPMLRRAFAITKPVARARAYTTGLGVSDLRVNGTPVSAARLSPGFTDYSRTVLYTTHDVTALLRQGENVLATELGSGQYDSETRTNDWGWEFAEWRATPRLRLDLWVTYADGTEELIASDASWKVSVAGPTRYDSYYVGETYDARREIAGWDRPGFDDGKWAAARIVGPPEGIARAQTHEADRVVAVRAPQRVIRPAPGVLVYATGQNLTGWARLRVRAPAGTPIEVVYTEKLKADSTASNEGNCCVRGQLQTDYYVARGGGEETWTPRFTYKGFQYVQVAGPEGRPLPEGVTVSVDSIEVVHTDLPRTSTLALGNGTLERIHRNTTWAVASNLHAGVMTDTPVYEKNPWTGDAQLSAGTASTLYDMERLWTKQLQDMVDNQSLHGEVSLLAPSSMHYGYVGKPTFKPTAFGGASPAWDAFWFVVPWESWQRYGDRRALERTYPAMRQYLDTWVPQWARRDGDGLAYTLNVGLGDWVPPAGVPTVNRITATAYYAYMARIAADAARALGKPADAARYDTLFARIRRDFNAAFLGPEGFYREPPLPNAAAGGPGGGGGGGGRGGQPAVPMRTYVHTAQLLPLAFGLVPDTLRARVAARLADDILTRNGGNAYVGVIGARWVLPVLTETGHHDVAYTFATQTDEPSWGYWTDSLKFTGLGEHWYAATRSQNHHFFGTIVQWLYEDLAGVRAIEPGYRRVEFRPEVPPAGLDSTAMTYESVRGRVASRWKRTADGALELDVTVPPNATGVVSVPAASAAQVTEVGSGRAMAAASAPSVRLVRAADGRVVYEVGSGSYQFRVRAR
jgi:alpha-L-rhamnosidase